VPAWEWVEGRVEVGWFEWWRVGSIGGFVGMGSMEVEVHEQNDNCFQTDTLLAC